MKLKKLLIPFFALVAVLAASCENKDEQLEIVNITVSEAEIVVDSLTKEATVELVSSRPWTVEVAVDNPYGEEAALFEADPWLSVDPVSGDITEGQKIRFVMKENTLANAPKDSINYDRTVNVIFRTDKQIFAVTKLTQTGSKKKPQTGGLVKATVAEFLEAEVSMDVWYELTGTIQNIANTTYGNFDLVDETGSVYIYGLTATKQNSGNDKSFSSIGLVEGDVVTIGTLRQEYNGSPQGGGSAVAAYYISHEKGDGPSIPEGDKEKPIVTNLGGFKSGEDSLWYCLTGEIVSINDGDHGDFDIKDVTGEVNVFYMTAKDGEDPADATFKTLGLEEGDVVSLIGMKSEEGYITDAFYQTHIRPIPATVTEVLNAAADDNVWYRITGEISEIVKEEYGNINLTDGTSTIYVYGVTMTKVDKNDKSFANLGLKVTDTLTLIGTRDEYDGSPQVGGPSFYVSHTEYKEPVPGPNPDEVHVVTMQEFIDSEADEMTWYELTGTISSNIKTTATNFSFKDETGEISVSQLVMAKGEEVDQDAFNSLNLKKGDVIKIHGTHKETFGSHIAAGPAYFIEVVERGEEEDVKVETIEAVLEFGRCLDYYGDGTEYILSFNPESGEDGYVSYSAEIIVQPDQAGNLVGTFIRNGSGESDGSMSYESSYRWNNKNYAFANGTKCVISKNGDIYTMSVDGKLKTTGDEATWSPIKLSFTGEITITVGSGDSEEGGSDWI